jgi:hypothetical protein
MKGELKVKKALSAVLLAGVMTASVPMTAHADDFFNKSFWKKTGIGALVGTGAAAVTDRSIGKGALVGAGVGAGMHAVDRSSTMQEKPLLRRTSKGAIVGAGVGTAATGIGALPGAAIGAGVGAVSHYFRKWGN